jgi:hypothetical protein
MLSKPLVITALIFQIIGVVWGLIVGFQNETLDEFFAAPMWPIYLGFVLLIVAVLQSGHNRDVHVEIEEVASKKEASPVSSQREPKEEPSKPQIPEQ